MKETGILFGAPMVRALLAGRKTQTRRLAKLGDWWPRSAVRAVIGPGPQFYPVAADGFRIGSPGIPARQCPYGIPGDRLWVRETFYADEDVDDCAPGNLGIDDTIVYAADGTHRGRPARPGKKRPGIFMPRWASRLTLEVTEVRVQRLQDISDEDAIAEGTTCWACAGPVDGSSENDCVCFHTKAAARDSFVSLWDGINADRSPWSSNPWLWVVSFRRVAT